jgi:hypothetical protein
MLVWLKSLLRHFQIRHLGAVILSNVLCFLPFAASLAGPLAVRDLGIGTLILVAGFLVTGQLLAWSGRVLDVRFRGEKPQRGGVLAAWRKGWAEGLMLGVVLIVLFSLAFRSMPYYWEQNTPFSWFSFAILALGSLLVLASLPYYLPVRRRENLGLIAAAVRSVRLMNEQPLEALVCAAFSLLFIIASFGTLGLFPGWIGLAALHQGVYDRMKERQARREETER